MSLKKKNIFNCHFTATYVWILGCVCFGYITAEALADISDNSVILEEVSFNYDSSGTADALRLLDHKTGNEIKAPEWLLLENELRNSSANYDFDHWRTYGQPTIVQIAGNPCFALPLERSHVGQDIDLSTLAEAIDAGLITVRISANVKADTAATREGFPYIYGYLIGKPADTQRINTYMTTGAIKSTEFTTASMTYQIPPHTRSIRVFMMRSSVRGFDDTNCAYFDDLSVRISQPTKPAAFTKAVQFKVKAKFLAGQAVDTAMVWATGMFGGLNSEADPVEVQFNMANGQKNGEAVFTINQPSQTVTVVTDSWTWYAKNINNIASTPTEVGTSAHKTYVTIAQPVAPMDPVWTAVLDYACQWANNSSTNEQALAGITAGLNAISDTDGDVDYDPASTYFSGGPPILHLSAFLDDLQTKNDIEINCFDCAKSILAFAAALGVNGQDYFIAHRVADCAVFFTNYIDPIGNGTNNPADPSQNWTITIWTLHNVGRFNGEVSDACLHLDATQPASLPCSRLTPANMPSTQYMQQLVYQSPPPPDYAGNANFCTPDQVYYSAAVGDFAVD